VKKQEKVKLVEDLKKDLEGNAAVLALNFQGLKMPEISEVRSKIKESGGDFRVIKNHLIRIAADSVGLKDLDAALKGPTALGWHKKEVVQLCKVVAEYVKKYEHLKYKTGVAEGRALDEAGMLTISRLPGRKEMLAQLAGGMAAGPRNFLWLTKALPTKMAGLLNALKDKKQ
jgi:large subunit ribosomal protein L10